MLSRPRTADYEDMTVAQLITDIAVEGRAPMPIDAPPVGPARARRLRLLRLRERLLETGPPMDMDAVAQAIARRAIFTGDLCRRLAEDG